MYVLSSCSATNARSRTSTRRQPRRSSPLTNDSAVPVRESLNRYTMQKQIGTPLPPDIRIEFNADDELPRHLATSVDHPRNDETRRLSYEGNASPVKGPSSEEMERLGVLRPELFVPLRGTEQLIGWITIGPKRSGEPYRENDVVFLTTLANQTAIALENAQLLEAAERRALQLATLNQVSRTVNQTLDLKAVLQLIMEKSLELLDAEAGSLLLADENARILTFEVVLSPIRKQLLGAEMAINSSSIAGTVANERKPLIVNDAQADPR